MTHAKPIGCRHGNAAPRLSTNPLAGMNAVSLPVGSPQPKRSLLLHDYAFDGNDDYRLSTAIDLSPPFRAVVMRAEGLNRWTSRAFRTLSG